MCGRFAYEPVRCPAHSAVPPAQPSRATSSQPLRRHPPASSATKGKIRLQERGESLPLLLPSSLVAPTGSSRVLGSRPGTAPATARFHISGGSWWGKPNPSTGVCSDLKYRVGYIRGEAVRSIPRTFSLFSPCRIYPTGSSPHAETHRDLGTAEQRAISSPTTQLSWKRPSWK